MDFLIPLIAGLIVTIVVFIALREVMLWYFKINQLISLQKIIAETQLKIFEQNGGKVDWEKVKKIIQN